MKKTHRELLKEQLERCRLAERDIKKLPRQTTIDYLKQVTDNDDEEADELKLFAAETVKNRYYSDIDEYKKSGKLIQRYESKISDLQQWEQQYSDTYFISRLKEYTTEAKEIKRLFYLALGKLYRDMGLEG